MIVTHKPMGCRHISHLASSKNFGFKVISLGLFCYYCSSFLSKKDHLSWKPSIAEHIFAKRSDILHNNNIFSCNVNETNTPSI